MAKKSARNKQQRQRQYQQQQKAKKQLALARNRTREHDDTLATEEGGVEEEVKVITGQMGRVSLDLPPKQPPPQQQELAAGEATMPSADLITVSPVPAGLSNVGNTCYYNSVMQVMGQTYLLYHLLTERSTADYVWNAKTFYLREREGKSFFASEQRQVPLERPSSILVQEFLDLQSRLFEKKPNNPRFLLNEIRKVNSQFDNWYQHDSQELLIALLDALKKSESARQVTALIKALDISDPKNASDEEKSRANRFKIAAKHTVVDAVFGGQLLSIIHCATCGYRSFTFEPFIDLSLSLNRHMPTPTHPNRKRNKPDEDDDDDDEVDGAEVDRPEPEEKEHKLTAKERKLKRQQKKAARREARKIARSGVKDDSEDDTVNGNMADQEDSDGETEKDEPKQDNEVVKEEIIVTEEVKAENLEIETISFDDILETIKIKDEAMETDQTMTNGGNPPLEEPKLEDDNSVSDVKYSKDDSSEELYSPPVREKIEADLLECLVNGVSQDSDLPQPEKEVIINGNGTDEDDDEHLFGEQVDSGDDPGSSDESASDSSCLSHIDEKFRSKFYHFAHQRMSDTDSQYDNRDLGALFRSFIKEEMLDGPNKYLCECCSKRAGSKMYSRAVRCQLIALPPPVLILHLKRFGSNGRRALQKLTTSISFPERFHLAPYTSRIYEYFSRFYEPECDPWEISDSNEHRLEYRLYGAVIHSGSLRGGHYMAYVCVRPDEFHATNLRRFLHLKPFVSNIDHILSVCYQDFQHQQPEVDGASPRTPPSEAESIRKWYFISDSSVSPTTLDSVLRDNGSPYILFYERTR